MEETILSLLKYLALIAAFIAFVIIASNLLSPYIELMLGMVKNLIPSLGATLPELFEW